MAYTLGVSSGYWSIKKDIGLLGIDKKVQYSIKSGVRHTQVDIESITELKEPDLKNKVERTKKLGITFGCHSEAKAYKGLDTLPLDSAIESDYFRAHDRLLIHIRGCGDIGAQYINSHVSESTPLILLWHEFQTSALVDVYGRKLAKFLDENPDLLEWAITEKFMEDIGHWANYIGSKFNPKIRKYMLQNKLKDENEIPPEKYNELYKEAKKEMFKDYFSTADLVYGSERVAYFLTAKWMMKNRDPLWMNIVGKMIKDEDLAKPESIKQWVPAVTAKYIWGHFNPAKGSGFEDPKPLLEKYKMYWLFETSMGVPGHEIYMRLGRLPHMYHLVKSIGSKWVGICMDMEHMMGSYIDPEKDIKALSETGGEIVKLIHITVPTSHNPSHLPIYLASEAQLYIYERLYELRKKGFKEGWMVFERGGEEGETKETTLSMRKIKEYLERDVPPKDLPLDFFGMRSEGPEVTRQRVTIQEHKLDPLKGMLQVPEEEFDFLGRAAKDKGKLEEWRKEKYR